MDVQHFESGYQQAAAVGGPPWDIGEPQPEIIRLARDGAIHGHVLDVGCGTGEHTLYLASLGYQVLGVDGAPTAIARAEGKARDRGVSARFEIADALDLSGLDGQFDTVIDAGLFHIFDLQDRVSYVRALHRVCRPEGRVHVLALSPDSAPDIGPSSDPATFREAFSPGWDAAEPRPAEFTIVAHDQRFADVAGVPVGGHATQPAWLGTAQRRPED